MNLGKDGRAFGIRYIDDNDFFIHARGIGKGPVDRDVENTGVAREAEHLIAEPARGSGRRIACQARESLRRDAVIIVRIMLEPRVDVFACSQAAIHIPWPIGGHGALKRVFGHVGVVPPLERDGTVAGFPYPWSESPQAQRHRFQCAGDGIVSDALGHYRCNLKSVYLPVVEAAPDVRTHDVTP